MGEKKLKKLQETNTEPICNDVLEDVCPSSKKKRKRKSVETNVGETETARSCDEELSNSMKKKSIKAMVVDEAANEEASPSLKNKKKKKSLEPSSVALAETSADSAETTEPKKKKKKSLLGKILDSTSIEEHVPTKEPESTTPEVKKKKKKKAEEGGLASETPMTEKLDGSQQKMRNEVSESSTLNEGDTPKKKKEKIKEVEAYGPTMENGDVSESVRKKKKRTSLIEEEVGGSLKENRTPVVDNCFETSLTEEVDDKRMAREKKKERIKVAVDTSAMVNNEMVVESNQKKKKKALFKAEDEVSESPKEKRKKAAEGEVSSEVPVVGDPEGDKTPKKKKKKKRESDVADDTSTTLDVEASEPLRKKKKKISFEQEGEVEDSLQKEVETPVIASLTEVDEREEATRKKKHRSEEESIPDTPAAKEIMVDRSARKKKKKEKKISFEQEGEVEDSLQKEVETPVIPSLTEVDEREEPTQKKKHRSEEESIPDTPAVKEIVVDGSVRKKKKKKKKAPMPEEKEVVGSPPQKKRKKENGELPAGDTAVQEDNVGGSSQKKKKKESSMDSATLNGDVKPPLGNYVPGSLSSLFHGEPVPSLENEEASSSIVKGETVIKPKVKKVKETIAEPDVNEKKELTENWKGRDQQRENRKRAHEKRMDLDEKKRTLFVGNAPLSMDERSCKKLFSQYGPIESVRMRNVMPAKETITKRIAHISHSFHEKQTSVNFYVKFKDEESVKKALAYNGTIVDRHRIRVDTCTSKADYDRKLTVFVGNLPLDVQEDDLASFFDENVGGVSFVRCVKDNPTGMGKGFAFVVFKSPSSVPLALGMTGLEYKKRELRISKVMKKMKVAKVQQARRKSGGVQKPAFNKDQLEKIDKFKFSTKKTSEEKRPVLKKKARKAIQRKKSGKQGKSLMQ